MGEGVVGLSRGLAGPGTLPLYLQYIKCRHSGEGGSGLVLRPVSEQVGDVLNLSGRQRWGVTVEPFRLFL
jgi:hypothetical protein